MEKNTVVLNLYDYLALKEFKEKIEKEYNQVTIHNNGRYSSTTIQYLTKDETIISLSKQIDQLKEQAENLDRIGRELSNKTIQLNSEFGDFKYKVKRLSIWEFIKYKIDKLEL